MADPETPGAESDALDRVWDIAERIDLCMLVTRAGDGQRVRPVYARFRRDERRIYILSDTKGVKLDQIAANPRVSLAFSDERANDYVVIDGLAHVSDDREIIGELWTFSDASFWKSPDNPDLRVIVVDPDSAELWDGSNLLVTGAKLLVERIAGAKVQLVENRKVEEI